MASESKEQKQREPPRSKPANPFFIFMGEFRQELKDLNILPAKSVEVAELAGERWGQMSNSDKLSYTVWARRNQDQNEAVGRRRNRRSRSRSALRRTRKPRRNMKAKSRSRRR